MSLKLKRTLMMVMVVSMLSQGVFPQGQAWAASGEAALFDVATEYMLRHTDAGAELVGRITGLETSRVLQGNYDSFVERMNWKASKPVRTELLNEAAKTKTALEEYRVSQGRPAELDISSPDQLPEDEKDFLRSRSEVLKNDRIQDLVGEQVTSIDAYTGVRDPQGNIRSFAETARALRADAESDPGVVPERPAAPADAAFNVDSDLELRQVQLNFMQRMFMRFRAVRRLIGALVLGEGDLRNLLVQSGKRYNLNDLATIRKNTRLAFNSLNDYAHMRLIVRAFANEPSVLYTRLNALRATEIAAYAQGTETIETLMTKSQAIAKANDIALNPIVWEAEKRMLTVLERCRRLGGMYDGTLHGGEIKLAQDALQALDVQLAMTEGRLSRARSQGSAEDVRRLSSDRDLQLQRRSDAAQVLEDKSAEFVINRDQIEIFANLRNGYVNSEPVAKFDMPDPFVATQAELNAWKDGYLVALGRSTNRLVSNELSLGARTQLLDVSKKIREINQLTSKIDGRKFTDTEAGKAYQNAATKDVASLIAKIGALSGVAISSPEATRIAQTQIGKIVSWLNSSPSTTPAAPTPPKTTTTTTTTTKVNPIAPILGTGTGTTPIVKPLTGDDDGTKDDSAPAKVDESENG